MATRRICPWRCSSTKRTDGASPQLSSAIHWGKRGMAWSRISTTFLMAPTILITIRWQLSCKPLQQQRPWAGPSTPPTLPSSSPPKSLQQSTNSWQIKLPICCRWRQRHSHQPQPKPLGNSWLANHFRFPPSNNPQSQCSNNHSTQVLSMPHAKQDFEVAVKDVDRQDKADASASVRGLHAYLREPGNNAWSVGNVWCSTCTEYDTATLQPLPFQHIQSYNNWNVFSHAVLMLRTDTLSSCACSGS